ncbi:major facilitator superfamily domain-containing protein [Xylariaceae sp. FL1019]|nr:major facilitator superfamily domain-containing protein [Xylariaceae sp. FL1019]
MSQVENNSLHELPPSDGGGPELGGDHLDTAFETLDVRQDAWKKRALVLFGASVSQLPIWGFSMSYGVFQEYYMTHWTLDGSSSVTGIIGTTSNGVLYLSMPLLFAMFTRRWAKYRQIAAVTGAVLASLSFIISSFSTSVSHLVATQGVLSALGCALVYSPTTLSLGEWFSSDVGNGKNSRAVAYGVTLSCKNIVGSTMPFLARALLSAYGFRIALRVWAALLLGTALLSIFLIPTPHSSLAVPSADPEHEQGRRNRKIPWSFLRHRTFYICSIAIALQSAGYGLPQSYLPTYATEVTRLPQTSATLLLTVFNVPGILASFSFGYLSDNKHFSISATTIAAISALCSSLATFLFWGLTSQGSLALLLLFSGTFGFFAGGYSAIWGGWINELESEAARWNEAIDPGMVYGLMNGARGIGYVSGGLVSIPLLKAGLGTRIGALGYSSTYGPLIVFTGLSTILGGCGAVWKGLTRLRGR